MKTPKPNLDATTGKLRIAHVITRMIVGGAQENTLLCCRDLIREHGDEVLLITGPEVGPEGGLLAEHPDAGVPVVTLDALRRAIVPWRDWRAYRQIGRALSEFRPDVVHTHSAKGGFLGRLAAARLGVPAIVHTVHGAPFHPYQSAAARRLFQQCERYAARRCHRLVSVADAMTDLMVDAGVAERSKFVTIESGMEVEPFLEADRNREATRRRFGFSPEHIVIGKIARLFHLKGHDDVIAAAARIVPSHPEVRFLFVGDGILRAPYEREIRRRGLQEHIRLVGLVPPSDIPHLIGAMDLLVHASLREGLARALPQALLAGKPVVSYAIDGAPEVVVPEQTGLLVRPRDIEGLSDSLGRLIEDRELRESWGRAGRAACEERFRHDRMTGRLRSLYVELLHGLPSDSRVVEID